MPEPTRRGFLVSTTGGVAALAAISLLDTAAAAETTAADSLDGDGPLVAYLPDPRSGRVILFGGTGSRSVTDRRLAASIKRLAGRG